VGTPGKGKKGREKAKKREDKKKERGEKMPLHF